MDHPQPEPFEGALLTREEERSLPADAAERLEQVHRAMHRLCVAILSDSRVSVTRRRRWVSFMQLLENEVKRNAMAMSAMRARPQIEWRGATGPDGTRLPAGKVV